MPELLNVYFLFSNTRTCFFYRNDADLRNEKSGNSCVKIQFGKNYEKTTYGSVHLQPLPEVPQKCLGVVSLLANTLGLKENEKVLVSPSIANPLGSLEISPLREEDYIILVSCKTMLESNLLSQIKVVAEGQILPVYVFSNIVIEIEIGKIQCKSGYGQLEKFTELTILHPSERPKSYKQSIQKPENTQNKLDMLFNHASKVLESVKAVQHPTTMEDEDIIKNILLNNIKKSVEYEIKPGFNLNNDTLKKIQNKYIIISNYKKYSNAVGPYCLKLFCKVYESVPKYDQKNVENFDHNSKENKECLYMFVISLNDKISNIAYCPPVVLKKLKLYVGSKIIIEELKPNLSLLETSTVIMNHETGSFWKSVADVRENVRQIILGNIAFNYKRNVLILGDVGMGKTFLLEDILSEFLIEYIYCKIIHCKTLRGKKIEKLQQLFTDYLRECACHEPCILFLDDIHALTYVDDEEQFNNLYSYRIVELISECLEDFQKNYNVTFIASAVNMLKLSGLVSVRGPRLFHCVNKIPEMNEDERLFIMKNLVKKKTKNRIDGLDFIKLAKNTNGFTVQDLNDLIDKAIFNSYVRQELPLNLNQGDMDSAFLDFTSLMLKGVKLTSNIEKKWEDVGGMEEAKQILIEVFAWPSKYSKILESSPLRLQKGVLLYGAPGTGKTILAGALATKCGLNFISVKGPEVLSKYVGASEEGVRNLFLQAQKTNPCLLFFDEFDSLAPKRGHDSTGVTDRVVNQLLTQLDGVEGLNGVWVLAATSRPDLIDPALLRPGRLDKMVFCDFPDHRDRMSILSALSKNLPKAEDVNLEEIAEKTEGYTGADLQAILYNSQMQAIKENNSINIEDKTELKITQAHLIEALLETKPSLSNLEKLRYKTIKARSSSKHQVILNATSKSTATSKINDAFN